MMAGKQSRAFWEQHVAACEASGSTRAAYCRWHSLKVCSFKYWRIRLRSLATATTAATATRQALVPVILSTPPPATTALELCVGDQVRLSLPASVDAMWLGTLLRLAAAC